MKHKLSIVLALALTAGCTVAPGTPSSRDWFVASNQLMVFKDAADPAAFTVRGLTGAGPENYWCAAGDFVMNHLHKPGDTRIYLSKPQYRDPAAGGAYTVGYTLAPDAALLAEAESQSGAVFLSLKKPGANMIAFQFGSDCYEVEVIDGNFLVESGQPD
ncbi:hypothetical protein [Actibacterium sp.]|uniref:hypothetical protein n=1 Tax=Actibacterium sp. TaxID=1872125 RepID=UPI0035676D19